nr:hypothetical protein LEP1GSC063_1626 [Leptospira santarosai serovar Arenal str. MAVJ 401]
MFIAYPKAKLQIKVATGLFDSVKSRISHSELSYVQEAYESKDHSMVLRTVLNLIRYSFLKFEHSFLDKSKN